VNLILLDWTRMGKTYCLAGIVLDDLDVRIVRPLPVRNRDGDVRKWGWSPYLLDGHSRWEMFELIHPEPAELDPPHLEDVWVRELRPLRRSATPGQRRAILAATAASDGVLLFGAALTVTRSAAYLPPGSGGRSLVTVLVPGRHIAFGACWRDGASEPDFRVKLPLGELGERVLAVKDHHLLLRAQQAGPDLDAQLDRLHGLVAGMGEQVAVRLGLSRSFGYEQASSTPACWLMADGFFSLADPQP
jgi:hypothetical protein